jgi:hypothetical protein
VLASLSVSSAADADRFARARRQFECMPLALRSRAAVSNARAMRGGAAAVAHRRCEQHRLKAQPLRPPTVRRPNRRRPDRLSRLFRSGSDHEPSRAAPRRAAPTRTCGRVGVWRNRTAGRFGLTAGTAASCRCLTSSTTKTSTV